MIFLFTKPILNSKQLVTKFLEKPSATAAVMGSDSHPNIHGWVHFYQLNDGVLVVAEVKGLPYQPGSCQNGVFGFHIHEGASCTGNSNDPFANTGGHYNPNNCDHPMHAGDLPPLFGNHGYAFMSVFTDRFSVDDVIGRTVVIHASADDFTTQPSGNSGAKIACGQILLFPSNKQNLP